MNDAPCAFCAIAAGVDASVEIVCKSERWIAFFPDSPATLGHTLVVPNVHVPNLWDVDSRLASELMAGVVVVGRALQEALEPQGMNLISSAGLAAEQTVPHLHLHVVPRWEDDRIDRIWPPKEPIGRALEKTVADRVRRACAGTGLA